MESSRAGTEGRRQTSSRNKLRALRCGLKERDSFECSYSSRGSRKAMNLEELPRHPLPVQRLLFPLTVENLLPSFIYWDETEYIVN